MALSGEAGMYSNSASSRSHVLETYNLNKQNLSNVKRDVSPLANAALALAQTAREMKAHVSSTTGNTRTLVFDRQGGSIQSKDLIKILGSAKDALKGFAAKAQSLDREIDFFSAHQDGLFRGNMAMIPQADKVNWCTGQVNKILQRASRLGADQAPKVSAAVGSLKQAARFTPQNIQSDLDTKVAALNRRIH
jgi:hypothetical protein